jgi:hypothetical protein
MTKPNWWKWEVTPGNVVSWIVIMVGVAIAYARVEARVDDAAKSISRLEAADVKLLLQIETARDLAVSRQEMILSRLSRIEAILDRVERNGTSRP